MTVAGAIPMLCIIDRSHVFYSEEFQEFITSTTKTSLKAKWHDMYRGNDPAEIYVKEAISKTKHEEWSSVLPRIRIGISNSIVSIVRQLK